MTRRLISYDIGDDKRRRLVVKRLQRCAHRVQYSVFEGRLRDGQWERLWGDLMAIVDSEKDSLLMVPLCGQCQGRRLQGGTLRAPEVEDVIVV